MMKPVIGITMGDPTGIGPEIVLKALLNSYVHEICEPIIFGDYRYLEKTLHYLSDKTSRSIGIFLIPIGPRLYEMSRNPAVRKKREIVVVDAQNISPSQHLVFGRPTRWGGKASGDFIKAGIAAAQFGSIDALVTAPINKWAFKMGGWGNRYPGHTEMLADLSKTSDVALLMVCGHFRVIHLTSHIPLSRVPQFVNKDLIEKTIRLAHQSLRTLGIVHPRIAVSGLNPHAGENGLLGHEEKRFILPGIKSSRKRGWIVEGPMSPDIIWPLIVNKKFDVGLALYHDQGQIPLKMLGFSKEGGHLAPGKLVNITAGLPFVRTSVGHGTAYDIAGKGQADETSILEAIKIACLMVKNKNIASL